MTYQLALELPGHGRTADAIARAVGRLISTGELQPGERLPPVRTVARQLEVSPSTITAAWQTLIGHGAIVTRGRAGTFVATADRLAGPGRYWQVPVDPGAFALDLSNGTADPALLPPLGLVLAGIDTSHEVDSYLGSPIDPGLEELLRADWPFEPEYLTVVDGAQDALDRLVGALVRVGDTVVVTDPEFPILLDRLEVAGAHVVGVPLDEEGPDPELLARALANDPVAVFLQPRAHNPTGVTTSPRRAAELAQILDGGRAVVVEDDHSGPLGSGPLASIGRHRPERVVVIRSFSKSHGPDLRLAAVGGAAGPIESVVRQRRLGASWTSHLLQRLLAALLVDAETERVVARAAAVYDRRRSRLVEGLQAEGIAVAGTEGFNIWLPVAEEQSALVALAAEGIGAARGRPFRSIDDDRDHIRLSIGTDTDAYPDLAAVIAAASRARAGGNSR